MKNLIEQLKRHEGFRAKAYECSAEHLTIGYGYNLDANPLKLPASEVLHLRNHGISRERALELLNREVSRLEDILMDKLSYWGNFDASRQDILLNMAYNMGVNGLLKFKKMLAAMNEGHFMLAADEMLDSKWAKQVGQRAVELAKQMRTNKEV